jgi:hypothetical protein
MTRNKHFAYRLVAIALLLLPWAEALADLTKI